VLESWEKGNYVIRVIDASGGVIRIDWGVRKFIRSGFVANIKFLIVIS